MDKKQTGQTVSQQIRRVSVLGILVTIAFVAIADVVLGLIIKACFAGSLRVSAEDEAAGLDVAVHGESAYPAYLGLD